ASGMAFSSTVESCWLDRGADCAWTASTANSVEASLLLESRSRGMGARGSDLTGRLNLRVVRMRRRFKRAIVVPPQVPGQLAPVIESRNMGKWEKFGKISCTAQENPDAQRPGTRSSTGADVGFGVSRTRAKQGRTAS